MIAREIWPPLQGKLCTGIHSRLTGFRILASLFSYGKSSHELPTPVLEASSAQNQPSTKPARKRMPSQPPTHHLACGCWILTSDIVSEVCCHQQSILRCVLQSRPKSSMTWCSETLRLPVACAGKFSVCICQTDACGETEKLRRSLKQCRVLVFFF